MSNHFHLLLRVPDREMLLQQFEEAPEAGLLSLRALKIKAVD